MTPAYTWLWIVLGVEGVALAGCLSLMMGRTAWLRWETFRWERKIHEARAALILALETGLASGDELAVVHTLPRRIQITLFVNLAEQFSGTQLNALTNIARRFHIVQHGEKLCRSRRWPRRIRGIRLLTALGEGDDIIPSLFHDPSPIVRSEVVHWGADHPCAAIIDHVLRTLTDADGFCRFAAHNALHRMGAAAVEPLERYLASQTGTALERGLAVAASLGHEAFADLAGKLAAHNSPTIRKLALDTLARAGDLQSAPLVIDRLNDPASPVRQSALRTLGHLRCWQAAPAMGRLLGDPVWTVRQEAGTALRSLGAPGILVLRRELSHSDRFVADMARHMLGLPSMKARTNSA
jgi:hypothetical protein